MFNLYVILAIVIVPSCMGQNAHQRKARFQETFVPPGYKLFGDMVLREDFFSRDKILPDPDRFWPNGTIPYTIDPDLDELGPLFKAIFADFHARTCIRFVERTTEEHYLRVVFGSVPYTFVGLARMGGQIFSLPSGLLFVGTGSTIHYFMHAIGVYHELNRIDRDDYIEINYDNLDPELAEIFRKIEPDDVLINTFDYGSIMMNAEYAFTKELGVLKSMKSKSSERKISGPFCKYALSEADVERVNYMYKCKK